MDALLLRPRVLLAEALLEKSWSQQTPEHGHILLLNFGEAIDLQDWTLERDLGEIYRFDRYTLKAKSFVRVHMGRGQPTATDLYLNSNVPIWDEKEYTIVLRDALGFIIDQITVSEMATRSTSVSP